MQQQQQQQQHLLHSSHLSGIPPQPDLSSIGPHTSNAQLAALLASVGNQGPDLSSASVFGQQQQGGGGGGGNNGGFSTFGSGGGQSSVGGGGIVGGGSSGWGMSGGHGGMGGNGGNGGAQIHPCRMHQQGHCRYGQSCRFQHIGPPGSGGNGGGFSKFGGGGASTNHNAFGTGFGNQGAFGNNSFGNHQAQQQQSHLQSHLQSNNVNSFQMRTLPEVSNSGNTNQVGGADESKQSDVLGGSEVPATFPNSGASFSPAGQQQQQQQQQAAPVQTPSFAAAPIANPNAALLQALLMQQQLTASAGLPANPELDNLIVSLNKSQQQQQMAAAAPVVAAPAPIVDQSLNQEFLLAQQSLASLALGASNSRPQQQSSQQSGPGGFNSYQNRNAPGQFGASQGPNMGNKHNQQHSQQQQQSSYQPQSSSYGGGGGGGHSHGQPLSSFHSGGNFGSSMNPAIIPQQMRFISDATNRDLRREAELFGPAHTTTTGINFDKYDDIPVEVTGNDGQSSMRTIRLHTLGQLLRSVSHLFLLLMCLCLFQFPAR